MAYIYCKNPFTGKRIEEGSTLPEDQVEIIAPCGHGPGAKDIRFPGIQYRKAFLGHYRFWLTYLCHANRQSKIFKTG
ncbi:hypothetical protein V7139_31140 [Neobacillus drentensis]|uniref:hypothetical protein n=1 Tax=Neobacillus drentensis TaxID=220684 RepID=UPI00300333C6